MSTSVQNDFYLYLVNRVGSDGALEATCKLPSTIDLSREDYEISLVEIQVPTMWHNVYDAKITISSLDEPEEKVELSIPDGYYKNFDTIIKTIDRLSKRVEYKLLGKPLNVAFKFGKTDTGKTFLVLGQRISIGFSERLMQILHLELSHLVNRHEENEARLLVKPDVDLWQYSLIAGCNAVPVSTIGDYSGRVLQVFSPQREGISSINIREIYLPVMLNMLDRVIVTLHDMRGHQLTFESDEMVILVHLRKVIKGYP